MSSEHEHYLEHEQQQQQEVRRVTTRSSKTYDHNTGLSCCFRQWGADSHCNKLHGYALKVVFKFRCKEFDKNGWVMDFGGLKEVKAYLESYYDHKTVVARNDPQITMFRELQIAGVIDLVEMDRVGCEAFARYIFQDVTDMLHISTGGRVWVEKVEVHEHNGNSAEVEVINVQPTISGSLTERDVERIAERAAIRTIRPLRNL